MIINDHLHLLKNISQYFNASSIQFQKMARNHLCKNNVKANKYHSFTCAHIRFHAIEYEE